MSLLPLNPNEFECERPGLRLIETPEYSAGTAQFENYMALRGRCHETPKLPVERVSEIQEHVRGWLTEQSILPAAPDYVNYSQEVIDNKIGNLVNYLRENFGDEIPAVELEATEAFAGSAFAMYGERSNNGEVHADADGTFAFVVPVRLSRDRPEYGAEVEPVIPGFRYVPNDLRSDMLIGLPPLIIDTYERDEDGKRGYLIFTPIYTDIIKDMQHDPAAILDIAQDKINDAVDFAQERLGVEVAGLGAVIPALTNYGKNIRNKNVVLTTGHGGTAYIVKETVRQAIASGLTAPDAVRKIGILGLGSIGASIAQLMVCEFPESEFKLYDSSPRKTGRTLNAINCDVNSVTPAESAAELISGTNIVVSAITGQIDLEAEEYRTIDMVDKLIVDDSQPGAFDIGQVEARNGILAWPIGHDTKGLVLRNDFDYGTMFDAKRDLFGCEAEAASLALYAKDMRSRGMPESTVRSMLEKVAVKKAVTPGMARLMGVLFRHKSGIGVARPQAFGRQVGTKPALPDKKAV